MNSVDFERIRKRQLYMANMRPLLNKKALFSDGTCEYISPQEPDVGDTVSIRFRTAKNNVDNVYVVIQNEQYIMDYHETIDSFDYYKVEMEIGAELIRYYFEIVVGEIRCFYHQRGVTSDIQEAYSFKIFPGFKTPYWAKGAVMYQIMVDRFYNGDRSNDVENREYYYIGDGTVKVEDWYKYPDVMGVREFYGGDLQGVMDKLDYLQDLGIEAIYFNPIFVSPSNHKYDIQDYDYIDPHYGVILKDGGAPLAEGDNENAHASMYITRVTSKENLEASNQIFIRLVEAAHERGMKVILDGVFNHCGSFNKWLDRERIYEKQEDYEKGAYVEESSPYRNFFKFNSDIWPYNTDYDGWWGHDTLPKLNYENSGTLFQYILDIAKKWVSPPYNADGWRLDVAADLGFSNEFNHMFWKEFRKAVKEANPEAIILAEHYGEPEAWLNGDEWDTVMNYDAFMEPITWFLTGMQKHSDEYRKDLLGNENSFIEAMTHHMASFHTSSLQVAMNELSNHDHSRFLTRTNHKVGRTATLGAQAAEQDVDKAVFREAVVMQMTWPGAPTIYYGDEAGLCGFTDPDNRRTYPWGREDHNLIQFHKELIKIHKEKKVISHGSLKLLYKESDFISYGRFNKKEKLIVLVNNSKEMKVVKIPVWEAEVPMEGELRQIFVTDEEGYSTEEKKYPVVMGEVEICVLGTSAIILYYGE
jgi:Glycosidases